MAGGQHGGPKNAGFTRQVPTQPEVEDNLYAFAQHHFFAARPLVAPPKLSARWNATARRLAVSVTFSDGTEPQKNELWWSVDRHLAGSLPFEYDAWQSTSLRRTGPAIYAGEISLPVAAHTIDVITTHAHTANNLTLSISSPSVRTKIE